MNDLVQRWAPHVTVATVVVDGDRLLMVQERIHGQQVLNQPAGHLEPGESLAEAALRETLEETGWEVALRHFIGCYQWQAPDGTDFLRFCFAAEPLHHHPERVLDEGIEAALWLTPAELQARHSELRSPLVWQVVADHLGGQRHSLDIVQVIA